MATDEEMKFPKQIEVSANGSYLVTGDIALISKIQVVSEMGEPLTWKKEGEIETGSEYGLCRCGKSTDKPFCDGTHTIINFDGSEHAPTNNNTERRIEYPGDGKLKICIDLDLCSESGFCANRYTSIAEMATNTEDIRVRTEAIGMVEHCPSGALTCQFESDEADTEVDLPEQIAVTTEITSDGPIEGPLWVTGGIPVIRADGQPFETRNRVTLCSCGHSQYKPLCDGSHRHHPMKK